MQEKVYQFAGADITECAGTSKLGRPDWYDMIYFLFWAFFSFISKSQL